MAEPEDSMEPEQRPTPRILVLDENPQDIETLREHLDGDDYEIVEAASCDEAFQHIDNEKVDLLLLDPCVSGIDSRDVCRRLRTGARESTVPVILLTDAISADYDDVLAAGADDFVSRPIEKMELRTRVHSLLRMKELNDDLLEKNQELQSVNQELMGRNREFELGMEMAHRLQQALLPQKYPRIKNIAFCHKYSPADAIGGDYFEFRAVGDDLAAVFLSDVSGHGVRAALVTSAVKAMIDHVALEGREAGEILSEINDRFRGVLGHMAPQIFATGFLMLVEGSTRQCSMANAGHPRPLLIRKDDMTVTPVMDDEKGGPAMGFVNDPDYQTDHRELQERDIVLGFTDGVYEVRNEEGEYYGLDRMKDLIHENARLIPRDLIQKIMTETDAFAGSHKRADDVCLVAVEVH